MAFTRNWDETTPDGAVTAASDIDLLFRQLKTDIRERLDDVSTFGSDTDPLELLQAAVEAQAPTFWGNYDADLGAGSRAVGEGRGKLLVIRVSGTTDANGNINIDLSEFTETFDITEAVILHAGTTGNVGTGIPHRIIASAVATATDTITFTIFDSSDVAVASGTVGFTAVVLVA